MNVPNVRKHSIEVINIMLIREIALVPLSRLRIHSKYATKRKMTWSRWVMTQLKNPGLEKLRCSISIEFRFIFILIITYIDIISISKYDNYQIIN